MKYTTSMACHAAGLKSLAEVARITGVGRQTLINWHKNKPMLFAIVLAGCTVSASAGSRL